MTIQEILAAHRGSAGEFCITCKDYRPTREELDTLSDREITEGHQAQMLSELMRESAIQAQVIVLNGVASAWEGMESSGSHLVYSRMLRQIAMRITKESTNGR